VQFIEIFLNDPSYLLLDLSTFSTQTFAQNNSFSHSPILTLELTAFSPDTMHVVTSACKWQEQE